MSKKTRTGYSTVPEADLAPRKLHYLLRLYVTGMTPQSARAVANIKALCEEYLHGRYELQVIDIYQQPSLARGEQILAVPTLIRKLPLPLRRLVGDLSDKQRVLLGLDLRSDTEPEVPGVARERGIKE